MTRAFSMGVLLIAVCASCSNSQGPGPCRSDQDCEEPALPFCDVEGTFQDVVGTCIACIEDTDCDGATPVCSAGACVVCVENPQCPSALCDIDTGACVAEANVVYADAENGADGGACGTKAFPCQSIAEALTKIDDQGRDWIKLADGFYIGALTLDGTVAKIVGDGAASIRPAVDQENFPVVSIQGDADILLRDLVIELADGEPIAAHGVRCFRVDVNPKFRLRRVVVRGNDGLGVHTDHCDVTIEQSEISRNRGGGVSVRESTFSITNNFIFVNGRGTTLVGGVSIDVNGETGIFDFNTLTLNSISGSSGAGIRCSSGATLILSNNLVIDNGAEGESGVSALSENCFYAYTCIDYDLGGNNVDATGAIVFVNRINDFHLAPPNPLISSENPCIDAAYPEATLAVDIDGDTRPQGAGRDIGADELVPQ